MLIRETAIVDRLVQPLPSQVAKARKNAGLSQDQAARLISAAGTKPYRTWQSYEASAGSKSARAIPLATWELFLLLTKQHPLYEILPVINQGDDADI